MQVTKNEKIVQVVQEETYDIKGLSKAEAIALLAVSGNTNGALLFKLYDKLEKMLGPGRNLSYSLFDTTGKRTVQDVSALEETIKQLAQE